MAYTKSTRDTRAQARARDSQAAKRHQCLEQARANLRDLNDFLDAKYRLAEVDVWLDERIAALHTTADARRIVHRKAAAAALADISARGMSVEEIARMAGMPATTVLGYLTADGQSK
jgi:hypothetical protein